MVLSEALQLPSFSDRLKPGRCPPARFRVIGFAVRQSRAVWILYGVWKMHYVAKIIKRTTQVGENTADVRCERHGKSG